MWKTCLQSEGVGEEEEVGGKCRRQGGGGIRETVGEMMTKVCIYSGVKTRQRGG